MGATDGSGFYTLIPDQDPSLKSKQKIENWKLMTEDHQEAIYHWLFYYHMYENLYKKGDLTIPIWCRKN